MLTVESALQLSAMEHCRVLAGAEGLGRPVTSVNQMEVPDLVNWTKEGQLIITTGYFIRNDVNEQRQLLLDLSEKGSAGLAIKIRRFFQNIPQHMISLADELRFPLIEIPEEHNISDIMNELMKELLTIQTRQIERSHEIHDRFTEIPLKGGGLNRIAELLGELTGCGVTIADANGKLVSFYDEPDSCCPMVELFQHQGIASPNLLQKVIEQSDPYAEVSFHLKEFAGRQVTYPVLADAKLYGTISVWYPSDMEAPVDIVSIKHAATIAGLEFLRFSALDEMRKRYEIDFFNDLLSGQIQSRELLGRRGAVYGIQPQASYRLMVVDIDNFTKIFLEDYAGNDQRAQLLKKRLLGVVKKAIQKQVPKALAVSQSDHVVVFLPVDSKIKDSRAEREGLVEEIRGCIAGQMGEISTSIVLGPRTDVLVVHEGYSEIQTVLDLCSRMGTKRGQTIHTEDYEMEKMLACMEQRLLRKLFRETAQVLETADKKENTQLVQTLEAFFRCTMNHSQTARLLFIHRNTLSYRLDRIREISDIDFENNGLLLKWQLGLKARYFIQDQNN
jgi:PucR family transcriptional regulator, purine catabolism regulatory protein